MYALFGQRPTTATVVEVSPQSPPLRSDWTTTEGVSPMPTSRKFRLTPVPAPRMAASLMARAQMAKARSPAVTAPAWTLAPGAANPCRANPTVPWSPQRRHPQLPPQPVLFSKVRLPNMPTSLSLQKWVSMFPNWAAKIQVSCQLPVCDIWVSLLWQRWMEARSRKLGVCVCVCVCDKAVVWLAAAAMWSGEFFRAVCAVGGVSCVSECVYVCYEGGLGVRGEACSLPFCYQAVMEGLKQRSRLENSD